MTEAADSPRLYVDTTILLDAYKSASATSARRRTIFKRLALKEGLAVTSEFTLAEVLGKEAEQGWTWQKRFYPDLLVSSGLFDLRSLTRELLIATGTFRKAARDDGRSVKLPDAIHAVTAVQASCTHLFTGDKRFVVPHPIMRLTLDEVDLATVERLIDA